MKHWSCESSSTNGPSERSRNRRRLLDKSRDAITVQDLDDNILFWNQSAERLYGWSAAEALGQEADKLLSKGPSRPFEEATQISLERGEWVGELQQVTRAGKEILVESRWTLVRDDEGRPKCRLIVNTDITEKKKLESQFLRAQRMESIGTLAGGVAHDINNVLTPIMMSVELLKMDLPATQRKSLLNDLEATAQRGADMVKQILSFARGVEGKRIQLQLRHIVGEIDKMLRRTLPKTIEMTTSVPRDLWALQGDPTQLHQMVMNLCVNARDAMPQGGSIAVTAANVMLKEADCVSHARRQAWPLCASDCCGHRHRHSARDSGQDLRPVLHDQGIWQGDRPRAVHRAGHRQGPRRRSSRSPARWARERNSRFFCRRWKAPRPSQPRSKPAKPPQVTAN